MPLVAVGRSSSGRDVSVVLKVRKPDVRGGHFGATSLACELICSVLARSLDLSVPDYYVVEIPRNLINAIPQESARRRLARNVGSNFGCAYLSGTQDWNPALAPNTSQPPEGLEDVLAFDSAIINVDRKSDNSNFLWDGDRFILIDHSYGLPMAKWSDRQVAESPLFPESQIQRHCAFPTLVGHGSSFALFDRWIDKIGTSQLETLRSYIPRSWEEKSGDLDRIFRFLSRRPNRFEEMQTELRRIVK